MLLVAFVWTVVWTFIFVWNLAEIVFYCFIQFLVLVFHAVLVYIFQHIGGAVSHSGHGVFIGDTESKKG